MAYIGSPFIATQEARAADAYKQAIVEGAAGDIVYSNYFTGVHGNYLKPSIVAAGMDPDNLPLADVSKMDFEQAVGGAKAGRTYGAAARASAPSRPSSRWPNSSTGWRRNTGQHAPGWRSEAPSPLFCQSHDRALEIFRQWLYQRHANRRPHASAARGRFSSGGRAHHS